MLQTTTDDTGIITSQTSAESINNQQSNSQLSSGSTNSANSSTTLSLSQITSDDIEQTPISQPSNSSTITLSSPSQTVISQESKQVAKKEYQTADGIFLEKEEYEALVKKASLCPDFKDDIFKIRSFISKSTQPEMDPKIFEKVHAVMLVPIIFISA